MTGYSNIPLLTKLGYELNQTVFLISEPTWFAELLSANNVTITDQSPVDWVHGFFVTKKEFTDYLHTFLNNQPVIGLWVSWPKKSSGVTTDLTEQTFRDYILPLGWVDTKVVAIDETWSALKFVRRRIKK